MARHCLGTSMQSSDVGLGKCRGSESQARPPSSHLGADVSDLLDSGRPKVPGHLRAWAETCSSGGSLTRWVPGDPGRGTRQGREALLPELCLGGPWTLLGLLTASQVARSVLEKKLLWSRPMRTAVRKGPPPGAHSVTPTARPRGGPSDGRPKCDLVSPGPGRQRGRLPDAPCRIPRPDRARRFPGAPGRPVVGCSVARQGTPMGRGVGRGEPRRGQGVEGTLCSGGMGPRRP